MVGCRRFPTSISFVFADIATPSSRRIFGTKLESRPTWPVPPSPSSTVGRRGRRTSAIGPGFRSRSFATTPPLRSGPSTRPIGTAGGVATTRSCPELSTTSWPRSTPIPTAFSGADRPPGRDTVLGRPHLTEPKTVKNRCQSTSSPTPTRRSPPSSTASSPSAPPSSAPRRRSSAPTGPPSRTPRATSSASPPPDSGTATDYGIDAIMASMP